MLILINNLYEKTSQKGKTDEILKRTCAIRNLHSCNNFAFVLHENALVFS